MPATRRPIQTGFSLIEVIVVVSIIALLMVLAVPSIGSAVANARARNAVAKFIQDFEWLRNSARTTSTNAVVLTLNADCSWSATVNGTADPVHSMATADLGNLAPGMACTTAPALPIAFSFTQQGYVTQSATLTFTSQGGQTWPLMVMVSGSVINTQGAS